VFTEKTKVVAPGGSRVLDGEGCQNSSWVVSISPPEEPVVVSGPELPPPQARRARKVKGMKNEWSLESMARSSIQSVRIHA
jgi:hypothetical protein